MSKKPITNWLDLPLVELQRQAAQLGFVIRVGLVPRELDQPKRKARKPPVIRQQGGRPRKEQP